MNKCISLLFMVACLVLTGCINQPVKPDGGGSEITNGRIYGTIYNPDLSPAAFATVTFVPVTYSPFADSGNAVSAPDSVVTDKYGQYRLDSLPKGFYNMLSKADSGKAYMDSVFIADSYDTRADDTLEVPGSIQGVARLEGAATDHSSIVILVLGTQTYALPHNTQGEYTIPPQAPGKYRLRFLTTVPGYGYLDTLIHVSPGGKTIAVDTVLIPQVSPRLVENVRLRYHKHTMAAQLSWSSAHPSLTKGYNIYRADGLGDAKKQNDFPLTDTLFNQSLLPFEGQSLYYTVTTVDLEGNESEHSSIVSIAVKKAYQYDSIILSPNTQMRNTEYDFDGDGNFYICGIDQILRKFDKSHRLLLETALDGSGDSLLPKLKQAMCLRHSAQGFILISDLADHYSQDTTELTLYKFDEDLTYHGKFSLYFARGNWNRFELSDNGDIYLFQGVSDFVTRIIRMDLNGAVQAERDIPYTGFLRIMGDTIYITGRDGWKKDPVWLKLDLDLTHMSVLKPGAWLKAQAGPDSNKVSAYKYFKCPNGRIMVKGSLDLDPPMYINAYNDTLSGLSFVSLFNSDGSLYSQFLPCAHAFFVEIGTEGELIFLRQRKPRRLYRYRDTISDPGIVLKTAQKKSGPLPPAAHGKIGKLTANYDPKTMYIDLNWSLFDQKEGRGFHLYVEIDNGYKQLVKKADIRAVFYREPLLRFANHVVRYSVFWIDRENNAVLLGKTPKIEVKNALTVDSVQLDWLTGSHEDWNMAVHPDGSALFLKGIDIIKCGPRGGNCQTRSLDTTGLNFKAIKSLNIMIDEKGRIITALMGSDSGRFPPYNKARVLLCRFNRELTLQDSLILDVGREESATSFFCSPGGEIFHHATLWYKTRMTIYDTSLVMRKTVELPGIIKQIQAMHDTVFIFRTRGGDCDTCLLVYYDSDFNKLGQIDNGFYFEHYSYLRTGFNDIHRLSDGRYVVTDNTYLGSRKNILSVVGLNDSLEAQVPLPDGTFPRPLKSNGYSVYMWSFPSRLYIVDIGILGFAKKDQKTGLRRYNDVKKP